MKIAAVLLCMLIFNWYTPKKINFTASTPAGTVVKSFLGIPLNDSVDFIRWKLTLENKRYHLQCTYGIGQPNTNGFINGGKNIVLDGAFTRDQNKITLENDTKVLNVIQLNSNLLHILDEDDQLLTGNGGWSYTLNNIEAVITGEINTTVQEHSLQDSMIFDGRTPCGVPGIVPAGMQCYKLKWRIIFYPGNKNEQEGKYSIIGTAWRNIKRKTGEWKMMRAKNNQLTYRLNDEKGNALIYLLKADENILLFTDSTGKTLVGNEDFSYTLNRKM